MNSGGSLGKDIASLVYRSCHGIYYIVGNRALFYDAPQFVLLHEFHFILAETPERLYLVRLDWTREEAIAVHLAEVVRITKLKRVFVYPASTVQRQSQTGS